VHPGYAKGVTAVVVGVIGELWILLSDTQDTVIDIGKEAGEGGQEGAIETVNLGKVLASLVMPIIGRDVFLVLLNDQPGH
jgi:hypothetical protein